MHHPKSASLFRWQLHNHKIPFFGRLASLKRTLSLCLASLIFFCLFFFPLSSYPTTKFRIRSFPVIKSTDKLFIIKWFDEYIYQTSYRKQTQEREKKPHCSSGCFVFHRTELRRKKSSKMGRRAECGSFPGCLLFFVQQKIFIVNFSFTSEWNSATILFIQEIENVMTFFFILLSLCNEYKRINSYLILVIFGEKDKNASDGWEGLR